MSRNFILIGGIAAFMTIAFLCLRHSPAAIEQDIEKRTVQQLNDADLSWARVAVDGRDLRISGLAPDSQARERAAQIAGTIDGVRTVNNRVLTIDERVAQQSAAPRPTAGSVAQTSAPDTGVSTAGMDELDLLFADLPYGLRMKRSGRKVALEGTMPAEAMIRTIEELAGQRFGEGAVNVALQVRPGAPANWLHAASASLALLEDIDPGEIKISQTQVSITGVARNEAIAERLRNHVGNSLPPGYSGFADITFGAAIQDLMRTNPGLAQRVAEVDGAAAPPAPAPQPAPVASQPASAPALTQTLSAAECQRQINDIVAQRSIQFAVASDVIDEGSRAQLDRIGAIAASCANARIEIAGHTDDQGTEANNLNLSQRRAESVMAYLVSRGVRLNRLGARGYGEAQPLVPNETADARAKNRRIEFNVSRGN